MKKTAFLLSCLLTYTPAFAAPVSVPPSAAAARGVERAFEQTRKLFSIHADVLQNLPKAQFDAAAAAIALVIRAKPSAQAPEFTNIPQSAFPDVLSVQIILDTRANVLASLSRIPGAQQALGSANALTVTQKTGGKYIHTVFIPTDDFYSGRTPEYITARLAVTLAHEIYGHVYHYLQEPELAFAPETSKEKLAYTQSVQFARAVKASRLFSTFSPSLQKEFRSALTAEEALLRRYAGR